MFPQYRRSRSIAATALLAGFIGVSALAAESPPPAPPPDAAPPTGTPRSVDVNKMKERAAEVFAKIDTNGDGKITEAEFLAAETMQGRGGQRMGPGMGGGMAAGPGGGMADGMVHGPGGGAGMNKGMGHPGPRGMGMTPEQQQAFQSELFKALDTDGNGQLSQAEFGKLHETMQSLMRKQAFTNLDTNGDGVLTKDEFPRFAAKLEAADTNGDGTVTREEIKAARQAAPAKTPN
jgi:Ca2+-binding EF-hand superfamily protein